MKPSRALYLLTGALLVGVFSLSGGPDRGLAILSLIVVAPAAIALDWHNA